MRALLLVGIVSLFAGCVSPRQSARSSSRFELGAAMYREGNVEGAIGVLREATKLDPRAWRPWNALAIAYIAKGQDELADEAFKHARRIAPGEAELLNNHGTLLLQTGRTDEAIAAFEEALTDLDYRNPALIQSNLSNALLRAGRTDEALRYARDATRKAPTLCEAWYNLGLVQEARKETLAALEAYHQANESCFKGSVGARLRTGCLQLEVGMADDGVALLEDILRSVPGTAYADQARDCMRTLAP